MAEFFNLIAKDVMLEYMEFDVKYHSEQQSKDKALKQLIKLFRELFGVDVTIGAKKNDSNINENTEEIFNNRIQKALKREKINSSLEPTPSLYELSFLKKLISGEFEKFTQDSFQTKKDKRLFEKFNALSKKQRLEQFNLLKIMLEQSA